VNETLPVRPGAIGNQLILPLAALMLGQMLWSAYRHGSADT